MHSLARLYLVLGTIAGGTAVVLGAFAAHALKDKLEPRLLAAFHTGVEYQFYHALALLAVGALMLHSEQRLLAWAGGAFALGALLFSGSLYLLALTGIRGFGTVTPLGGLAFIAGWLLMLLAILRWPAT